MATIKEKIAVKCDTFEQKKTVFLWLDGKVFTGQDNPYKKYISLNSNTWSLDLHSGHTAISYDTFFDRYYLKAKDCETYNALTNSSTTEDTNYFVADKYYVYGNIVILKVKKPFTNGAKANCAESYASISEGHYYGHSSAWVYTGFERLWREATTKEREHLDQCIAAEKYVEYTPPKAVDMVFKVGDYVEALPSANRVYNVTVSGWKGVVFQVLEEHIEVGRTDGKEGARYKVWKKYFKVIPKPVDESVQKSVSEMEMAERIQYAKIFYPDGTTFNAVNADGSLSSFEQIINIRDHTTYSVITGVGIDAGAGKGFLYAKGVWARKTHNTAVSAPEKLIAPTSHLILDNQEPLIISTKKQNSKIITI